MKKVSEQLKTKAYEIGVMKLLKEVAESGDDVHENHTPLEICDMMLDKVDLVSAKSILVLYNIELLFALRKEKYQGHVTFFTQSTKKAELAPKIFEGVNVEYIDKEENPLYLMENKWPDKFDVVIANPPYSKKLDLKFLDKAFDIANNEVVFVHPATMWISKGENKYFESKLKKFSSFVHSIEIFNGNGIFGIGLYTPCSITHLLKNPTDRSVTFIDKLRNNESKIRRNEIVKLSPYGISDQFNSIYEKIYLSDELEYCSSKGYIFSSGGNHHQKYLRNQNCFFVELSNIRGHCDLKGGASDTMYKEDFFTFLRKDSEVISGRSPKYQIWFEFNTSYQAQNFSNYLKTNFARMCLALVKRDQHIKFTSLPWMDFTQEWTDEKLYAHFNITEEEQTFIKEVITPYYD